MSKRKPIRPLPPDDTEEKLLEDIRGFAREVETTTDPVALHNEIARAKDRLKVFSASGIPEPHRTELLAATRNLLVKHFTSPVKDLVIQGESDG